MTQRFPVWASFFTFCGIFILCSLGTWQIKRLHWKQDILTKIESARAEKSYPVLNGAQLQEDNLAWTPATLRGRFRKESFHVVPRTYNGKTGFHVVTPLILSDGGSILVNRGWIPAGQKVRTPDGNVRVSGLLRSAPRANMFTPPNNPSKNEWYTIDPFAMADSTSIRKISPYILYAETESGNPEYPVRAALNINPANNHLSYAVFWFTMAGILALIYFLRFAQNQKITH